MDDVASKQTDKRQWQDDESEEERRALNECEWLMLSSCDQKNSKKPASLSFQNSIVPTNNVPSSNQPKRNPQTLTNTYLMCLPSPNNVHSQRKNTNLFSMPNPIVL